MVLFITGNLEILVISDLNFFLVCIVLQNKEENKLTCPSSLGTAVHFLVFLTSKLTLIFNL